MSHSKLRPNHHDRTGFIGGSDARIIMGGNKDALLRLWREKRGEIESEDFPGNLSVQLGWSPSLSINHGSSAIADTAHFKFSPESSAQNING